MTYYRPPSPGSMIMVPIEEDEMKKQNKSNLAPKRRLGAATTTGHLALKDKKHVNRADPAVIELLVRQFKMADILPDAYEFDYKKPVFIESDMGEVEASLDKKWGTGPDKEIEGLKTIRELAALNE